MSRFTCRRHALAAFAALALLLEFTGSALAQKAAIVSAVRSTENTWWQFVKAKIVGTGLYPDGVDQIDIAFSDPTLAQLAPYKLLVIMSSDYGMSSSDGVGNALGDYMATVPGASVLVFQPYLMQTGLFGAPAIGGSFNANYALTSQSATASSAATKRGMVVANDPLVDGVIDFDCGSTCTRVTSTTPKPGASVVAYWADGTILAVRAKHRVDLNMLPADDTVISGSWKGTGGELITNAILYLTVPVLPSPRQITFPGTALGGATAPTTFSFRNISDSPVDVTGIGFDGTGKSQFEYKSLKNPTVGTPYTLAIGETFKVDVTFKPQVQGTHKAVLYLNLAGLPRIEAAVQGVSKGNLYVSLSPIDFGGIPGMTTAGPTSVRLKNLGTMPIDLDKPVITDTTHYVLNTTVPDDHITMFPGASYTFDVKFVPGADTGKLSTEITITSTDASSPLTIPVLAMAGPPQAQVPYTSILLPDVPNGAKGIPLEIAITNIGYSDLSVNEISADKSDFLVPNAPSTMTPLVIPAQQIGTFNLVFAPQMEGLRTGKLTIKSNEPPPMGMPDSNKTILLSGTGTSPKFKVNVTDIDFGTVDIGSAIPGQGVNLINDGDGDLTVKDVSIVAAMGSDSFAVTTLDPVPFTLRAGSTVTVTVKFTPKSAGALTGTLRVVTDLAMGGSALVNLKGTANGAVGVISPATLAFGDQKVKNKVTKTITLTNNGNKDLTILKSSLTPTAGIYQATLPPDNTKVAAGKSISIDVTCLPAMAGPAPGHIDLQTDDPAVMGGTKFTSQLTVNGVLSNVLITPMELDFMPVLVGHKSDMLVAKVQNIGTVAVDNLSVAISGGPMGNDSADFNWVPGFKTMLMPGDTSEIGVVFEPHVAKSMQYGTLVITADGVQVPMTVALKGSSMSATISAQPDDLKFDTTIAGQMSKVLYARLSNDGAESIDIDVVPPASQDFIVDTSQTKLTLAMGDTTQIAVTFAPQTPGPKGESIDIHLKDTNLSLVKIDLEGQGVKATPPAMDMGGGCHMSRTPHSHPSDFTPLAFLAVVALFRLRRRVFRPQS